MSVSTAAVDGIVTRYEVAGSGPPLLMFSPGGFNATLDSWETHGLYQRTRMLARLRELVGEVAGEILTEQPGSPGRAP